MPRLFSLLMLLVAFAFFACGGGGSNPDADSSDQVEVDQPEPDVLPDTEPDVIPDTEPDVIPDTDPDLIPDVDPDVIPDVEPDAIPDVEPDVTPTASLELSHNGTVIAVGSLYGIPSFNPSDGAVAIYSEQKDRMVLTNKGSSSVALAGIELVDVDDVLPEEYQLCTTASGVNQCIPYAFPNSLGAGELTEFYIHFYPLRSGERFADLVVTSSVEQTYRIRGRGRIGSDVNPAYFFSSGTETSHKLWGGFTSSADENPGSMVVDPQGNMYFAHTTGMSGDTATIVRINTDGSFGWAKVYNQYDIRETADDGGYMPADALAYANGYLYLVGQGLNGALTRSVGVVMKLDAATGNSAWIKYWHPTTTRLQFTDASNFMAVDVGAGMVFVTGHVGDNATSRQGPAVVAFDDSTGGLLWSKLLVPQGVVGTAHRGHSIRYAGNGVLYVAGIDYSASNKGPFLAKLTDVDASGSTVGLAWAQSITGEVSGSNFNSMDVDTEGNAYLSVSITGASRKVPYVRVNAANGALSGINFGGATNSWHTPFVVRIDDTYLYVGARIGIAGWDSQKADGFIAKLNKDTMSKQWAGIYYTGTGVNEICAHSVHGMAVRGNELYVLGQVYTGNGNFYRYHGLWYDDPVAPAAYSPTVYNSTATTLLTNLASAGLVDGTTSNFVHGGTLQTLDRASAGIEWQNVVDKNETTNGAATDGDIFVSRIQMN